MGTQLAPGPRMSLARRHAPGASLAALLALALGCEDPRAHDHDEVVLRVAPDYPVFTMAAPIRPEDLRPGYVARLSPSPGHRWHDLNLVRWKGLWTGYEPGPTTEQNEADWGVPVHAGVDGVVVDCWRNTPYVQDYSAVDDIQPIGGNYLLIRTDDDHYVYYAHMDTGTIPPALCPHGSKDGWMDQSQQIPCLLAPKCLDVDTYLEPQERPTVHAGQFLGRIGAHGNASGAHLHMHVGYVIEDADGWINTFDDDPHHLVFDQAWYKPQAGSTDATPWIPAHDPASRAALIDEVDAGPTLLWPGPRAEATHGAPDRLRDYDGDGDDDLLCHDVGDGTVWVAGSGPPPRGGSAGWCHEGTQRLHTGDFDGDGRDDLLCHERGTGQLWVDLAGPTGAFSGPDFTAADVWCPGDTQQLLVGDFDADGRDDLLCHDYASGLRWIDWAEDAPLFGGTDAFVPGGWCQGHDQRIHVGRFDADAADDLLCHATRRGTLSFDHAQAGTFGGTDAEGAPWCMGGGQRLLVGNVQGSAADELLCLDGDDGSLEIDAPPYDGTDWAHPGDGWCSGVYQRAKIGDVDGDGRDDLLCIDLRSGMRWVDHASDPQSGEIFGGTDWASDPRDPWCTAATQGLH
ncbi:MAG: VCBS repeat-containing protein [Myxococcales bacterium]|nr:VCBS repeat-containing protein [Myxococcales bacterium]